MDIYTVNEELVKTLDKMKKIDILSKQFNATTPNYEKVHLIEKILVRLNLMQDISEKCAIHSIKNDEEAKKFRTEGNLHFSQKNRLLFKAYEFYNKSLCYADSNENLSLAFANRSAVYFEWKLYKECLENIEFARKHEYPDKLQEKLNKREKDCLQELEKKSIATISNVLNAIDFDFKLSFEAHPKVPFIANCLDISYTKDLGRYIITKESLKPGQLISIEEEYTSSLVSCWKYLRCANCKQETLNLIPCESCTSTMFCNENCKLEANFHKFECPIIDLLFVLFNKIHLIALRVVLTTINLFDSIEDCIDFCNKLENQNLNSFELNYKEFTKKEQYKAIHSLVTNQEKRPTGNLFQRAVIAAVLKYYILDKSTDLKKFLNGQDGENFFTELLFKHLQVAPSNFHSVDLIEDKKSDDLEQSFASGAYAFGSLINHSCAPNIVRIYKNTKTYIFVLRPISANDVILDNYGYHYATQPKEFRIKNLDSQYRFCCTCEACSGNYKMYDDLPRPSNVPQIILPKDIQSIMEHDPNFASDNYQRYCDFLNKYAIHYPCVQISSVEESLKMVYNILFDSIALKAKVNK